MPETPKLPGGVFLSYAREDSDAARRIADALRSHGIEVWFDQSELRGGDSWDAKIRKQINDCALFVPIISRNTQERGKGYFRLEWKLAVDQTHLMAEGMAFLAPVVIDDTPESKAVVPPEFMKVQWSRLPGALPTPQFVEQVKRLFGGHSTAGVGAPGLRAARPGTPIPAVNPAGETRGEIVAPPKPAVPRWLWAVAAGVIAFALAGILFMRKPATTSAPPPAPAPSTPVPAVTDKSIAVLPFTNMSEDKDNAFFADGMQEDILTNLALIREFRVVSRTSVMSYRTTTKSIRQIAQELGVTYILEGSVQREGNKVRVTGQLIQADKDEHLWAKAYDRDLSDIFAIQSELSQAIAMALQTVLSPEEKGLLARRPTDNPAAYDLFLRARDVRNREGNNPAAFEKAIQLYRSAVGLDPKFTAAWAELADTFAFQYFSDVAGKDGLAAAKAAMDRAVALAPDDPEVIGCLGTYYYYCFRDYDRAVEQYERLARLRPNDPTVFNSLGLIQRRQGRWAEALANIRRASELDPANLTYLRNLMSTLRAGRHWGEATATQRRIATLLPDKIVEGFQLALIAFQATGSTKEGQAFFDGLSAEQANSPRGILLRAEWASETGNYAEGIRLDRLQPYFDETGQPHWYQAYFAAVNYFSVGDRAGTKERLGDFPAELRDLVKREPTNLNAWEILAGMEAMLGEIEPARRDAEHCVELMPVSRDALDGATAAYVHALVCDWTGEREKALAEYTRLLQHPTVLGFVHELKATYSTLSDDPRYQALLADPKNNAPLF
jgi:TolB-like protein/Tfp pilus assembly protein PilF